MSVVIYGGRGWIGLQVQKLLAERNIPFQLAKCRVGSDSDEEVSFNPAMNVLIPTIYISKFQ